MRRIEVFLGQLKAEGKSAAAFGASLRGNALLSFCGVRRDTIAFVADLSPRKHGLALPGTGIPIVPPQRIQETRPDFIFVLPGWSVQELVRQHHYVSSWGGRFGRLDIT